MTVVMICGGRATCKCWVFYRKLSDQLVGGGGDLEVKEPSETKLLKFKGHIPSWPFNAMSFWSRADTTFSGSFEINDTFETGL